MDKYFYLIWFNYLFYIYFNMLKYKFEQMAKVKSYFTFKIINNLNNYEKQAILSLMRTNKKWSINRNKLFYDIVKKNNLTQITKKLDF